MNGKLRRSPILIGSVLAVLLTACGSSAPAASASSTTAAGSSSAVSSASEVATATDALAKYTSAAAPVAPGPAFDASKAGGKLVWIVEQVAANPVVAIVTQNLEIGLTHERVKVLTCDAHGVAAEVTTCITQGIAQNPAAIVAVGGDPTSFSAGIRAAKSKNIPVISALDVPPSTPLDASQVAPQLALVTANAAQTGVFAGPLAADYIVKASNAHANVLFISSPDVLGAVSEQRAFSKTLKELCPSCTIDVQGVNVVNWATDLGPTVSAQLQLHPDINYVVPVFDPMTNYVDPAILQAGKAGSIKVVTVNGSLQQMTDLSSGNMIVADVGQDMPELGFQAADETLRAITGQTGSNMVANEVSAMRMFTKANIDSVTLTPGAWKSGEWYTGSPSALENLYYKLWSGQ